MPVESAANNGPMNVGKGCSSVFGGIVPSAGAVLIKFPVVPSNTPKIPDAR